MTNKTNLPVEVVEKILKARDALIVGDKDEAYHQLYGIASPGYDSYYPWREMELQVNYPIRYEEQIKEAFEITEYAIKLKEVDEVNKALSGANKAAVVELNEAKKLLDEVFRKHESGLLPDRFVYEKIKTFLYEE